MLTIRVFYYQTNLEALKNNISGALTEIQNVGRTLKVITNQLITPTLNITQRRRKLNNTKKVNNLWIFCNYTDKSVHV